MLIVRPTRELWIIVLNEKMDREAIAFGKVTADPAEKCAAGTSVHFRTIVPWNSDATDVPGSLTNWESFDGALLAILFKSENSTVIVGSAVMIAPGLAVSATHVFDQYFEKMEAGELVPYCIGVRKNELTIWSVRHISANREDDLCLLSLVARSAFPDDMTFFKFGLSTRSPLPGELVHIIGFRNERVDESSGLSTVFGNYFASKGEVVGTYPGGIPGRFMPFPLIEINCGSLGGMSGGAVVDSNSLVLGVISRGMETEDQRGPTYANWVLSAMSREVSLEWPPGLHKEASLVFELRQELLHIDDRQCLAGTTKDRLQYRIWMNKDM